MKLLVTVLHIALLAGLAFYGWRKETRLTKIYWPALVFKLLAGISLGLIYQYYYSGGDTFHYFREGVWMADLARKDPHAYLNFLWLSDAEHLAALADTAPRALFFIKISSLFCLITWDNYWIITLYFSFLSFAASWMLVKVILRNITVAALPAIVSFLFFPSMVFWSSGLIKESLACAVLYFLSGIFLKIWFGEKVKLHSWIISIAAAWVLWNLKYYFAAVFFSVAVTCILFRFVLVKYVRPQSFRVEIALWMIVFIITLGLVSLSHPNFYPQRFLSVIVENYHAYESISAPQDQIHFYFPDASAWTVLINTPWALISGLFRPFVWEADNILKLLIALENLFLIVMLCFSMAGVRTLARSPYRMLIFIAIVYIIILCVFLTLSTPNFGTLSRYRVGYLPYFIFLVLSSGRAVTFLQRSFMHLVR